MYRFGNVVARLIVVFSSWCSLGCGSTAAAQTYTHPFDGYSFSYPNGWEVGRATESGETIVIRNFPDSSYGGNGERPAGGAEIDLGTLNPKTDEHAYLRSVVQASQIHDVHWDPSGIAKVTFVLDSHTNGETRVVLVAPRKANKLFYVSLNYALADEHGPDYERVCSNMIASIQVQLH